MVYRWTEFGKFRDFINLNRHAFPLNKSFGFIIKIKFADGSSGFGTQSNPGDAFVYAAQLLVGEQRQSFNFPLLSHRVARSSFLTKLQWRQEHVSGSEYVADIV